VTVSDLISALRAEVTDDGHILLDKLEVELKLHFWPGQVFEAAVELFGPALNNPKSRNRLSLDRRIRHALTVWDSKYRPLTPEQEQYASSVLCAALRSGEEAWAELGKPKSPTLIACVLNRLADMVNHEKVHDGFKRRSGRTDRKADLQVLLGGEEAA
jgi:hypothetical protein